MIVSGYVERYRGQRLELPQLVVDGARFGVKRCTCAENSSASPSCRRAQHSTANRSRGTALRGDVPATFRLQLLPPLAVAAAVAFKLTGSDKGVW